MDESRRADLRQGRYVLVRTLGEGTQGETFEAVDKREGRLVAIKRFRVASAKGWKDVEMAEREATTLAGLSHPSLPAYIEHFEEGGALYLVMERIDGESLKTLRKQGRASSVAEVVRMLEDAADALRYLHAQAPPVVHRDLKPGNVLVREDGSHAFVDFGSVGDRLRPEGGSTIAGTFGYMAPEQFQGRALPASDVYGIGATALAMLTGREPESLPHRGLAIDVAASVPRGTPEELVKALSAMLDPNPDVRASSVAEALELLSPKQRASRGGPKHGKNVERTMRDGRRAHGSSWHEEPARARDGARRSRKARRRARRRSRVPLIWRVFAHVGLVIARLAVHVTVGVAVPLLLVLLSILFGGALRRAARACYRASGRAGRAIGRAHARVAGRGEDDVPLAEVEPKARVATDDGGRRVRVGVDDDQGDQADEAEREEREEREAERETGERARRRQR